MKQIVEKVSHNQETVQEKPHVVVHHKKAHPPKREEIKIDEDLRKQLQEKVFAKKHHAGRRGH